MDFVTVRVRCPEAFTDIIIAELFGIGFDSFQELADGFEGSCTHDQFSEEGLEAVFLHYPEAGYAIKEQEKVNWNEEWEKNYDPISVEDTCLVRATFHQPDRAYEYEIVVNPKMSFGTGHHATTYQALAYQLKLDHRDKKVLDVGTGTGILAIMACLRGAKEVVATDIDDWCIENSKENFALNNFNSIQLVKGEIDEVRDSDFDIVIANINKNVLMAQVSVYTTKLKPGGQLVLSGFYKEDVDGLLKECQRHGLEKAGETNRDNWSMLALTKRSD